ncbi:heavy-metal-associated domain-containing protein [Candidatus Dependentiae bacterium]|nr:heavy-metal-associated domain-containing protein [Candidatus Dependentiae bacterium]
MNHNNQKSNQEGYTLTDFMPLIFIFTVIIGITVIHQLYYGWDVTNAMRIFMAAFFLVFGGFKVINIAGFAKAYAEYDLIAAHMPQYGYIYPFLEVGLGFAYLTGWQPIIINSFALILMLVSAAGVFNELRKGKQIICACLGVVFKIPMTYVTLFEDLLMAGMAFFMLLT